MISFDVGRVIAGKYRLERPLAEGGMGALWVARHLQLDTEVVLKLMAPAYAESVEARARFEREAKACAQLRSPHVVQVHDYGVEDETPFLVMELLEGEDLDARIRRRGRLTVTEAVRLLLPVCKALRRAHDAGIVHRDIKPTNVFLARAGVEETVKVLDFGIAKVKATPGSGPGHATRAGVLLGSPNYMSPEQVRSKDVDHRSDLWSLGVVFFQAITGQLPFPGDDVGDVLVEICTDAIPVASQIVAGLDPAVDQLLARALTRDRSQRFQSARELGLALAALPGAQADQAIAPPSGSSEDASSPRVLPSGVAPPMANLLSSGLVAPSGQATPEPVLQEDSEPMATLVMASRRPVPAPFVPTQVSIPFQSEARTAPGISTTVRPALDDRAARTPASLRRGPVVAVAAVVAVVGLVGSIAAIRRTAAVPAAVDAGDGPLVQTLASSAHDGAVLDAGPQASVAAPSPAAVVAEPAQPSSVASGKAAVSAEPPRAPRPAAKAVTKAKSTPSRPPPTKRDPTFGF